MEIEEYTTEFESLVGDYTEDLEEIKSQQEVIIDYIEEQEQEQEQPQELVEIPENETKDETLQVISDKLEVSNNLQVVSIFAAGLLFGSLLMALFLGKIWK